MFFPAATGRRAAAPARCWTPPALRTVKAMVDDNEVVWPVILFDDSRSPAAAWSSLAIYSVREPQDIGEIRSAFDARFRPVSVEPEGRFDFTVKLLTGTPDEPYFRVDARIALRLYGPQAEWSRGRMVHGDPMDTTEWTSVRLQDRIIEVFSVGRDPSN